MDPDFADELKSATALGFTTALYSQEAVEADVSREMVNALPSEGPFLLRGWMMTGEQYEKLYCAVIDSGAALITNPERYAEAHYLPLGYEHIKPETPESAWIEGDSLQDAWCLYQPFRNADAIIKDWVKSAKHRWREACFIPAGTDEAGFERIFKNFRQARGHLFNRGVVIRRFVPLATRGTDLRGFPLVDEYRLFYFDHRLLAMPRMDYHLDVLRNIHRWDAIAARFASRFISIDVARLDSGDWTIVEVGDGGVSGLPLSIDVAEFYAALLKASELTDSTSL